MRRANSLAFLERKKEIPVLWKGMSHWMLESAKRASLIWKLYGVVQSGRRNTLRNLTVQKHFDVSADAATG
jgi:hypothetical protein